MWEVVVLSRGKFPKREEAGQMISPALSYKTDGRPWIFGGRKTEFLFGMFWNVLFESFRMSCQSSLDIQTHTWLPEWIRADGARLTSRPALEEEGSLHQRGQFRILAVQCRPPQVPAPGRDKGG